MPVGLFSWPPTKLGNMVRINNLAVSIRNMVYEVNIYTSHTKVVLIMRKICVEWSQL